MPSFLGFLLPRTDFHDCRLLRSLTFRSYKGQNGQLKSWAGRRKCQLTKQHQLPGAAAQLACCGKHRAETANYQPFLSPRRLEEEDKYFGSLCGAESSKPGVCCADVCLGHTGIPDYCMPPIEIIRDKRLN